MEQLNVILAISIITWQDERGNNSILENMSIWPISQHLPFFEEWMFVMFVIAQLVLGGVFCGNQSNCRICRICRSVSVNVKNVFEIRLIVLYTPYFWLLRRYDGSRERISSPKCSEFWECFSESRAIYMTLPPLLTFLLTLHRFLLILVNFKNVLQIRAHVL